MRVFLGFDGRSIERDPRLTLGVFLSEVLAAAKASSSDIELHCQRLTYINSATISCFVEFIRNCIVQDVRLTVRYSGAMLWQRSCFGRSPHDRRGMSKLSQPWPAMAAAISR